MSEKNGEDQDPKPDQDLSLKNILADVDTLLAEEDPEFLSKLSTIKINDSLIVSGDDIDISEEIKRVNNKSVMIYFKRAVDFKNNTKTVMIFWTIFLVAVAVLAFVWINRHSLLSHQLFITSMEKLGNGVHAYNPNEETEPFYDNTRFAKNLISLNQVHVNLKPSENSGNLPMAAFELTVEGLSTDAIVEIKDRQAEFKDLLTRLTEEKTYDDLVDTEGKRLLCEQYRNLLNENLTRGQVRRVLIKNFIIKP